MRYFGIESEYEHKHRLLDHSYFCGIVQEEGLWHYVDLIRSIAPQLVSFEGNPDHLMLDVEYVATNRELIPEDIRALLEHYQAWLQVRDNIGDFSWMNRS